MSRAAEREGIAIASNSPPRRGRAPLRALDWPQGSSRRTPPGGPATFPNLEARSGAPPRILRALPAAARRRLVPRLPIPRNRERANPAAAWEAGRLVVLHCQPRVAAWWWISVGMSFPFLTQWIVPPTPSGATPANFSNQRLTVHVRDNHGNCFVPNPAVDAVRTTDRNVSPSDVRFLLPRPMGHCRKRANIVCLRVATV